MEKQLVVFLLAVEAQLHQTQTAVLAPRAFRSWLRLYPALTTAESLQLDS